jgi:hypothetical protein
VDNLSITVERRDDELRDPQRGIADDNPSPRERLRNKDADVANSSELDPRLALMARRLLDRVRDKMRPVYYAIRTEESKTRETTAVDPWQSDGIVSNPNEPLRW